MEPLSTAAIAIGSVVATTILKEAGKEVGKALGEKTVKFLSILKKQSPDTATAIEKAPKEPLDYDKAVQEVESAALANPEVNQAMEEVAAAAKAEENPEFSVILSMPNLQQLADKINNFAGRDNNIGTQNNTF